MSQNSVVQLNSALAGRYDVEREIGAGGMATVYLARDVKHDRKVALKVLNPELGAVLGVERFLSEIKVTANLQHPNLLPLFDSGAADGLLFYVMPFVEGESLRARLDREKQLPVDEAVRMGVAIANALDYAHRHGVIHRDLKPENVMLQDGQPLLADFGIALAVSKAGGSRITQTGLSLGTPHYMSPEQATGDRTIDARSDIYSLGAMVYEMLAGEPPHTGNTSQAIIARVLTEKPRRIRLGRPSVPQHVESAVEHSLEKLPADRFSTAHDFAAALSASPFAYTTSDFAAAGAGADATPSRTTRARRYAPWLVAAAALAFAAWSLWRAPADVPEPVTRFEIWLQRSLSLAISSGTPIAISPDGALIAYAVNGEDGSRRVFLRRSDDLTPRLVPGSENGTQVFFSPDSKWVAFYAAGQLKKASVDGGSAVTLADVPGMSGASWAGSNEIIVSFGDGLMRVSGAGGTPAPFSRPDTSRGESRQWRPHVLPDGKTIGYTSWAMGGANAARIGLTSIENPKSEILDILGTHVIGYVDGMLVYVTSTGLVMAVQVDLKSRRVIGTPTPMLEQVAVEGSSGAAYADVAANGDIIYQVGAYRRRLYIDGAGSAPRVVIPDAATYVWPRLSPDGKRIAISITAPARTDVWVYELPGGPLTRVTREGTINDRPEWLPDSKTVVFRSNRGPLNALWKQTADGSGVAEQFFGLPGSRIDEGMVSSDGQYLAYQRDTTGIGDVWFKRLDDKSPPVPIEVTTGADLSPRISPDGKWVAYQSNVSSVYQIYVRPFPSMTGRVQVSLGGGVTPVWSRDGQRLVYAAGRRLIAARLRTSPDFTVIDRDTILERDYTFTAIHADFDVMPDGRILVLRPTEEDAQLIVVRNWAAELRSKVAAGK